MNFLLCDSGIFIASMDRHDAYHRRCARLLDNWPGIVLLPEPVLGETCNFLRNQVRNGPQLESQFLTTSTTPGTDVKIVDPEFEDRRRAAELVRQMVDGPLGYVDAIVLAIAERLAIPNIATIDFKFLGMASPVSRIQPLNWVFQATL